MIRYSYNQQVTPPAPFVHVGIRSITTGTGVADCPAQIDTAADTTVLPQQIVEALELEPLDQVPILGFDGHLSQVYRFLVSLSLHNLDPLVLRVLASADEPYVLLGRDVLNQYRILLDGPQLKLDIG
jgi:predicted aspartyl protease